MDGRKCAFLLVAGALGLAACSERPTDAPTSPDFGGRPTSGCSFNDVSSLIKTEFGASSQESSWETAMKNAGAGTDGATYIGYLILGSIEAEFNDQTSDNSISTVNASQLTVALLQCMNVGGAAIPSATTFQSALQYTGAYGVRGLGGAVLSTLTPSIPVPDTRTLYSHDHAWLIEPPAGSNWQAITTVASTGISADTLKAAVLLFGKPGSSSNFSNDIVTSTVYDWSSVPKASFDGSGFSGAVVGECVSPSNFLQHNPATSAEVLGFIKPSCWQQTSAFAEPAPRTFAEQIIRFFGPAPLAAAALTSTGTGGSKGSLSPFGVINPQVVNLSYTTKWSKSGYVVNQYFPEVDVEIKTFGGTRIQQPYVFVWLSAINNQGTNVQLCNNWDYTDARGVAAFTKTYLNKAGGYTIKAFTSGTTVDPQNVTFPSIPPGTSPSSPLINVKNDTGSPPNDTCLSYTGDGTDVTGYYPPSPND